VSLRTRDGEFRQPNPGPFDADEFRRFNDTFMYREGAFLVDEIVSADYSSHAIVGLLDTTRGLPFAREQRVGPGHPAHVSGAEMVMATGSLGCLHAWFFHGCRWDEGWTGFGTRIHRADFKQLARIGPPLRLESKESRARVGSRRIVLRFEFRFWQGDALVYRGDQSAMFFRDFDLG
jgi:hypothetical protein